MPTFDITAPDGTRYEVTGPEGSTEQQALAQVQAQHQAPTASTPDATLKQRLSTSLPVRFGRGAMDIVGGGIQAIAHAVGSPETQFIDDRLKAGEDMYQADRKATGQDGIDFGRIAGNIASPINFALPGAGGAGLLGRIGLGIANGGILGGLQPVNDGGNFADEKTKQVGLGIAGGVAAPVLGAGVKLAAKALPHVLGGTTGTGSAAVKEAFQAGKAGGDKAAAFTGSMRGDVPWETVVADAKGALGKMREDRNAAYRSGMTDISKDASVLDFKPIDDAISQATNVKTFKGRDLSKATADVRKEITDAVDEWRSLDPAEYHTPEGIDALKQQIGDIKDNIPFGTPSRVIADQVYNSIRGTIAKQAPAYDNVMKDYAQASEQISNIQRELSLGSKGNPGTALKKLQSVMRNNANTNWGARADMADQLAGAGATTLLPQLAGQSMNAVLPRGLARVLDGGLAGAAAFTNPGALAALPLASPRAVGELAYGAGKLSRGATALGRLPVINKIPALPPGVFLGAGVPKLLAQ